MNHSTSQATEDTTGFPVSSRQKSARKWIRVIGSAEGISFLLLLFVAMPIKYLGHNPTLVHWLGPVHGGLFLLYLASVVAVARILNWRWLHIMLALVASVVPFGPFVFEAWLRRLRPLSPSV
jgi:integral membrane protein